jgi:hypothetical protein
MFLGTRNHKQVRLLKVHHSRVICTMHFHLAWNVHWLLPNQSTRLFVLWLTPSASQPLAKGNLPSWLQTGLPCLTIFRDSMKALCQQAAALVEHPNKVLTKGSVTESMACPHQYKHMDNTTSRHSSCSMDKVTPAQSSSALPRPTYTEKLQKTNIKPFLDHQQRTPTLAIT